MEVTKKAYGKVNLGLKVVKKDKNGYHKLQMIMAKAEIYDEIIFKDSDSIIINMDKNICKMEDNLCYKIALYLNEKYNISKGIEINIKKHIPDGGGLGGGSSDAAEVLMFLNEYWNIGLNKRKLKKIGFSFGCDIPFFIEDSCCYVYGYGQKIKKINKQIENRDILIIKPNFSLSTKNVFKKYDNIGNNNKNSINDIKNNINDFWKYFNDLEYASNVLTDNKIFSIIKSINKLKIGKCVMTGSGSCLICYLENSINVDIEEKVKKELNDCEIIKSKLKVYSY